MKITRFDRTVCMNIGKAVTDALKPLEDKFGISFNRKGGAFSDTSYTMKIEMAVVAADGTVLSREAENFKKYCMMYNLEAEDLGKTFIADDGYIWKVTGLNSRSRKYPILAERAKDGKTFKLGLRMVQKGLGRKLSALENRF